MNLLVTLENYNLDHYIQVGDLLQEQERAGTYDRLKVEKLSPSPDAIKNITEN